MKSDAKMIKEEYTKLAKKYSLPKFEEIDAEFEISEGGRYMIRLSLR